ncbi:MAG: Putative TrmH family tRNA/rRNA methyltransferase [Mycoplasmataceae bacterium]|nr:MAG: Putative TrmH family tRNA/rRNA methyltransferase [Mycoplasmataceae bacterium]
MKNNLIAFGRNTLKNLINSDFFDFKKIIISEDKQQEHLNLIKKMSDKGIIYEIVSKKEFERHIPDKKHQGVIAFIRNYNYSSINYLMKKKPNHKLPFLVMLDSIEDPHNFGAIIRTCAAMEVDGIIISSKHQVPVNSTVIKVSTGGISYVPICQVNSLEETINTLKLNNYSIVSTVCDEENLLNYNDLKINTPICVVFGNEHDGIKNKIVKKSDILITIPLENDMNSLNVSVSCGIIVSSISRSISL